MLPRIPPLRRAVPVLVAVFIAGAGIGALGAVIFHHSPGRRRATRPTASGASNRRRTAKTPTQPRAPVAHTAKAGSSARVPRPEALLLPAARPRFAALAAQLHGRVGVAVAPLPAGAVQTLGDVTTAHAWSTSKVPVLVALMHGYQERGQALSGQEQLYATRALEQSDNAAIEALFGELEQIHGGLVPASAAVQTILRRSGDQTTSVNTAPNSEGFTTYGQSEWSVRGEVTFYRALADGCLLDRSRTAYILGLMRSVVFYQRWGAGSAGYPPSDQVAFKGGWGPSNGAYQVRQTAIIGSGRRGYVISFLALPASGAFEDGVSMVTALARWARRNLRIRREPLSQPCPSPTS